MDNRFRTGMRYIMPSILSCVSVFFYTIVDGIFVGRGIGSDALGAVNIAFPFVMFFGALVMLCTVGGMAVAAIRIGRGDREGANRVFMLSLKLSLGVAVIFSIPGLFLTEPIGRLMGAGETYREMVREYLFWYSVFLIPGALCTFFNGFLRNDGAPGVVSAGTVISTALNILGDYVLIFPLGMGLKGAAIATGAAQTINFLIDLVFFLNHKGVFRLKREGYTKGLAGKIMLRGLPECVSQFSVPVSIMLTNWVLAVWIGDAAINAFSVLGYAASFSAAVFVGVAEGIQPLLGQNYGSCRFDDLRYYFRMGLIISFVGSVLISLGILILWDVILDLFAVDAATRLTAQYAVPRYMPGFAIQSLTVVIGAYLYSTTRTREALIINILRGFVLDVLIIPGLPLLFGPDTVWYTFGVYEGIALVIAWLLLRRADRNGPAGAAE